MTLHTSCFKFQAKIVAEAANGPVTPLAETILEDNDVVILPDLLLNAVSIYPYFIEDYLLTAMIEGLEEHV